MPKPFNIEKCDYKWRFVDCLSCPTAFKAKH